MIIPFLAPPPSEPGSSPARLAARPEHGARGDADFDRYLRNDPALAKDRPRTNERPEPTKHGPKDAVPSRESREPAKGAADAPGGESAEVPPDRKASAGAAQSPAGSRPGSAEEPPAPELAGETPAPDALAVAAPVVPARTDRTPAPAADLVGPTIAAAITRVPTEPGVEAATLPDDATLPTQSGNPETARPATGSASVPSVVPLPQPGRSEVEPPRRRNGEIAAEPAPATPSTPTQPTAAAAQVTQTLPGLAVSAAARIVADAESGRNAPDRIEADFAATFELRAHGAETAKAAQAAAPDLPRAVAQQVVEAARHLRHGPVELTLSPEELGRVRLTLTSVDGAMTLAIQAERQDTLDLLRRNVEMLAADYREMGFGNLNFSFSRDGSPAKGGAPRHDELASPAPTERAALRPVPPAPIRLALGGEAGLDLRL